MHDVWSVFYVREHSVYLKVKNPAGYEMECTPSYILLSIDILLM